MVWFLRVFYSGSVVFFFIDKPNIDVLMEVEAISLVAGNTIHPRVYNGLV